MATFKDLQKAFSEFEMINEDEEDRLEAIKMCVPPTDELDDANGE